MQGHEMQGRKNRREKMLFTRFYIRFDVIALFAYLAFEKITVHTSKEKSLLEQIYWA